MKRWALVVIGLSVLIVAVLTVPVTLLAFAPQANAKDVAGAYLEFSFWLWLGVMALAQAALLGALAVGTIYALGEFAARDQVPNWFFPAGIGSGAVVWCVGSVFLLYVVRWRRLHAEAATESGEAV